MTNSLFKYENVHWSLPMLFQYEAVYAAMYKIIDDYGIRLPQAYLYGSPSCAWTGGRPPSVYGQFSREKLLKIMHYVYLNNAVPTFTFSCTDIKKEDLKDEYANVILDAALEAGARFIVCSDMLRDYIKSKDPNATVVASVIKPALHFQGPDKVEEPTPEAETEYYNKLLKEYDIVVVRPEYSKGALLENPKLIDDISRIEVLINQTCVTNCPKMPEHYKFNESLRVNPNLATKPFECVRANIPIPITYQNYTAHTEEQVQKLVKAGVQHLKLQGRSDNFSMNVFMMLLASQMFHLDGANYSIAVALAKNIRLAQEFNTFNYAVLENPLPQQQQEARPTANLTLK